MSRLAHVLIVGACLLAPPLASDDALEKQRQSAALTWKTLFDEAPVTEETEHFIICAASATTPAKQRELGKNLESSYGLARKKLKVDDKENLWTGKLTVYFFSTRPHLARFMRTIAKKRSSADDFSISVLQGDVPYVAVGPSPHKFDPHVELLAVEQIAAAILSKHGGEMTPAWLLSGFGRAVCWQVSKPAGSAQRGQLKRAIVGKTAADVWDGRLAAEDAGILRASLVEFLAFGPGASSFPQFVAGFKPGETGQRATTLDALQKTSYSPESLTRAWHLTVARGR